MQVKLRLTDCFKIANAAFDHVARATQMDKAGICCSSLNFGKEFGQVNRNKVRRKKITGATTLDIEFGLVIFLGFVPLADGDVTLVHLIINIAQMFPVLAIVVLGSVGGFTIVFGENGIPDRRSIIIDVDGE